MESQQVRAKIPKTQKIVYSLSEEKKKVDHLWRNGRRKGYHLGFDCLKDYYTILPGRTTYLYGAPYSGKSYVWFEFMINLSEQYGLKHGVFSVEMGDPHEIFFDLVMMVAGVNVYMGKKLYDSEYKRACDFVHEHFFIIDPNDLRLSVDEFFNCPDMILDRYKTDIHTLTGDPFNEFAVNMQEYKYRDLWVGDQLTTIRKKSKQSNIHTCIINHARDQQMVKTEVKETKKRFEYYPIVSPRDLFGGQEWYRKGLGMISVWRPPEGFPDEDGFPASKNEIHLIIQKDKPRGIGQRGTVKLYLDHEKHRYYEATTFNPRQYGHKIQADDLEAEWGHGSERVNGINSNETNNTGSGERDAFGGHQKGEPPF